MQFSDSALYDFFNRALNFLSSFASGYAGLGLLAIGTFVAYRLLKKMISPKTDAAVPPKQALPVPKKETSEKQDDTPAENGTEKPENQVETALQKEDKLKEAEDLKKKESLEELFDLFSAEAKKERRIEQPHEQELEELGLNKQLTHELRAQIDQMIEEVSRLMDKGLTKGQISKTLISRSGNEVPLMELQPLIDALNYLLNSAAFSSDKELSVIGIDPAFERKAAYSALMRGDYEEAVDFLERAAEKAEKRAASSRRGDIKEEAEQEAADIYRAAAVLSRPSDMEKSFSFLEKSYENVPEDCLTKTMIGRAYYESGKTKQAVKIFESVENMPEPETKYAAEYASSMVPYIRIERTTLHARRIRQNYENKLDETFGIRQYSPNETIKQVVKQEIKDRTSAGREF